MFKRVNTKNECRNIIYAWISFVFHCSSDMNKLYNDAIPGIVSYTQYGAWFLTKEKLKQIGSLKPLLEDYKNKWMRCRNNIDAFAQGIGSPNEIISGENTPTFVYRAVDVDEHRCHFLFNMVIGHAFCLDNEEQVAKILSLQFLSTPFQLAGHTWERNPRSGGIDVMRRSRPRQTPITEAATPVPTTTQSKKKSSFFSFLSPRRGGNWKRQIRKTTRGNNRASATRRRARYVVASSRRRRRCRRDRRVSL